MYAVWVRNVVDTGITEEHSARRKVKATAPMQTKAQIITAFAVVAIAFVLFLFLFLLLPVSNVCTY